PEWTGEDTLSVVVDGSAKASVSVAELRAIGLAVNRERSLVNLAYVPQFPGATWVSAATGNYETAARGASAVTWIVIHTTEGSCQSAVNRFQDPTQDVSAHFIVCRDGSVIQMVREQDTAYHAGNLSYNTRSIGIE